jgi:hypothetical protein
MKARGIMISWSKLPLVLLITFLFSACTMINPSSDLNTPTVQHNQGEITMQKIIENPKLLDFGWMPENPGIYYAVGRLETNADWFVYDLNNLDTKRISNPFQPTTDLSNLLSNNQTISVNSFSVSPDKSRAIYTVNNESKLSSTPTPANGVELTDLWFSSEQGHKRDLLVENFSHACGKLASKSIWRQNEKIVLGTCHPYNGVPVQFIAYPEESLFYVLQFTSEATAQELSAFQANVSYDGKWLAIVDQENKLWLVPLANIDNLLRDGLNPSHQIAVDGTIYGPEWSSDNHVYFWQKLAEGSNKLFALKRLNPDSGEMETIITDQDVRNLLGEDLSEKIVTYRLPGFENGWSIDPSGSRGLLAIGDNITIQSLWLFTW